MLFKVNKIEKHMYVNVNFYENQILLQPLYETYNYLM